MVKRPQRQTSKESKPIHHPAAGLGYAGMVVLILAVFFRVVFFLEWLQTPFSTAPIVDAWEYHTDALIIAAHGEPHHAAFWHPPLYPYLLASVYRLTDSSNIRIPMMLQHLMGLLSIWLTMKIALMLSTRKTAIISGVILGVYPLIVCLEGQLLTVSVETLLNLACLWFLVKWDSSGRPGYLVSSASALALSALTRPSILLFLPVAFVWLAVKRFRSGIVFAVTVLLMILPVTVRNYYRSNEWVFVSTNGGINFFIGNSPDSDRLIALRPGSEWSRLIDQMPGDTDAEKSRAWYAAGVRFWLEHPARATKNTLQKSYRFLHADETMRNQDYYSIRRAVHALKIPWFDFGYLIALSVIGWPLFARTRQGRLLAGFLLAGAAGIIMFFVTARYRVPIIPLLSIGAAAGLYRFVDDFQNRRFRAFGAALILFATGSVLTHLPIRPAVPEEIVHRDNLMNLADIYERTGRFAESIELLKTVNREYPDFPDPYMRIGLEQMKQGDLSVAETMFRRACTLESDSPLPFINLGLAAFKQNRFEEAAEYFRMAASKNPNDPNVLLDLAKTLTRLDQNNEKELAESIRLYQQQLQSYPFNPLLNENLGRAFWLKDDLVRAERYLTRSIALHPRNPDTRDVLVSVLIAQKQFTRAEIAIQDWIQTAGDAPAAYDYRGTVMMSKSRFGEAIESYSRALAMDPSNGEYHNHLAVAYLAAGDRQKAVIQVQEAKKYGYPVHPELLKTLDLNE